MLLLHLLPTCPDAGPDLCTFCPDLCTLRPDLCTLRLWCYSSINPVQVLHLHTWWRSLAATCAGGILPSAIDGNTPCTGGLFLSTHWLTYSTCAQATCTMWRYILHNIRSYVYYIYIYIYIHTCIYSIHKATYPPCS